MTTHPKRIAGITIASIATLLWSVNYVIARALSDEIPPITLAFFRWSIALIVITPFSVKSLIRQWSIIKKKFWYFALASLLGVALFNTLIYAAGQTTTATNLSLIAISAPIFIIIISRIAYNEKFPVRSSLGIIIAIIGLVYLISKGEPSLLLRIKFVPGDILMLLAAICFASYSVLMKKKPPGVDVKVLLLVTILLGVIMLFPAYLIEVKITDSIEITTNIIVALLYVGIAASLVAFYLWNHAILIIGAQTAGLIYYAIPVFSSSMAIIFLNEKVYKYHFISMMLIIAGIFMATFFKLKTLK